MPSVCHHARNPKASHINVDGRLHRALASRSRKSKKVVDQRFESRIVPRRQTPLKHHTQPKPISPEQPKIAFRPANIPSQNHPSPINTRQYQRKLTSALIVTATGSPSLRPGSNFHCCTALTACSSRP